MTKTERLRSHIRQAHADDRDAKGHSDYYHLGLCTGAQRDALRLSADCGYTRHKLGIKRYGRGLCT
ncbi:MULTISPECIES: autotransporter domain-containing protein [Pseudomonas]|uniref:Autotransporter n=1 Tax=Pseudomonas putida TaxID=303 RepID=A0A1L7NEM3_PSEPU|nr:MULTISPECIES: autotransporter domain-containing protein [Pseudomonas]MBP2082656.1 hypothetical protein [Pseudomonas sp. PvP089]MBP2091640.1 hypothetical protein [Pseudomonas sp. PvP088]MBP2222197.1 hypothetical protein [Pseudomonas putida]PMY79590.1 autotransporter domain-containing protein [Pseudomonas sp. FW306-2-2C-D06B]BAW23916.1 autotransporter [Pseudomonas putida]